MSVEQFVANVERRYRAYLNGKPVAEREAIIALFKEADVALGSSPEYQLAKYHYLMSLDETEAAVAAFATVPDDVLTAPLDIANRLRRRLNDPGAALPLFRRLSTIQTPLARRQLVTCLHDDLAQWVAPKPRPIAQTGPFLEFVASLGEAAYPALAEASCGLRSLVAAQNAAEGGRRAEARKAECQQPGSYGPRYRLLLADLLTTDAVLAQAVRETLVTDLQKRVALLDHPDVSQDELNERARYRYWIAYGAYREAEAARGRGDLAQTESLLRTAAQYSPDRRDLQGNRPFYERAVLGGLKEYRSALAAFLENQGRLMEGLVVRAASARLDPTTLDGLREAHGRAVPNQPFEDFWRSARLEGLPVAPDFTLRSASGVPVRLSSLRGKWVLLDFWGTWCSPCVAEIPLVEELHRQSQTRSDFAVLTVASRDTLDSVRSFIRSRKLTMPVVMADERVLKTYRVPFYPYKLLIAPDGRSVELASDSRWVAEVRNWVFGEPFPREGDKSN